MNALAVETRRVWDNGRADPVGFSLLLPDKFQARTGKIAHTISGRTFWQSIDREASSRQIRFGDAIRRHEFDQFRGW